MPEEAKEVWKQVDQYFVDALIAPSERFDFALEVNRKAELPAIDVTSLQGKFLEVLVRGTSSKRILEIGTLGGYSTLWLARAIPDDGIVMTLELEPHHAQIAKQNLEAAGFADRIDLRIGPAADTLAALVKEHAAAFDFIFIDADKASYPEYLQWCLKLSRPGTLIFADNVVRDGKVIDGGHRDPNIQGVRRFTEMVSAEPRLSATALQTVAGKGYDGFIIAVVLH
ncbi:O-methyltransferase [Telmatobacter sp. DSM 110680]|uniref:O-methyltransferase n=1 Tax=Telmatobacter sp. DSM 110680 TaxID=3036704 RepID=A0AAU7DJG7_9BACT